MWVEKMVWPLAEVKPYRRIGSESTGGWDQNLKSVWTARDRQEHFASERFEQGKCGREKMFTRSGRDESARLALDT